MPHEHLIDALNKAVSGSPKPAPPHSHGVSYPSQHTWEDIKPEFVTDFVKALTDSSELAELWARSCNLPHRQVTFGPLGAAIHLTDRCRYGVSAKDIIAALFEFVRTGEIEYTHIQALTNIEIKGRIEIAPGLCVLPPTCLDPNLAFKVAFVTRLYTIPAGMSALVVEKRIKVFEPNSSGDASLQSARSARNGSFDNPNTAKMDEALKQARLALIVEGGISPHFGARYGIISSIGWPVWPVTHVTGIPSDYRQAALSPKKSAAIQAFYHRGQIHDPVILLALDRLETSRLRKTEIERAIDLGACLEFLLMHETKSINTEITNKISHRGAWLIGKTASKRQQISSTIKTAYQLRSDAVHQGKLNSKFTKQTSDERAKHFHECETIVAQLVNILRDGWPNWDDVTLGARRKKGG